MHLLKATMTVEGAGKLSGVLPNLRDTQEEHNMGAFSGTEGFDRSSARQERCTISIKSQEALQEGCRWK